MSKSFPVRQKLAMLSLCFAAGLAAYFAAYAYISKDLTQWQREQPIDFDAQTGSTRFKAHVDALTVGGFTFCITAAIVAGASKIRRKKCKLQ